MRETAASQLYAGFSYSHSLLYFSSELTGKLYALSHSPSSSCLSVSLFAFIVGLSVNQASSIVGNYSDFVCISCINKSRITTHNAEL